MQQLIRLPFILVEYGSSKDHKPYFGLSFGDINDDVSTLNIETWIHPLMKQARHSNDLLKNKQQNQSPIQL